MVTCNNCCVVACVKFNFPCDKKTSYRTFKNHLLFEERNASSMHRRYEFCIFTRYSGDNPRT